MATAEVTLFSADNALTVADSIVHFAHNLPNDYLALAVVSYENGEEVLHPNLFIKLDNGKTTLADTSEIVHCRTDDGRRVDVLLGKPTEREFQPARILVAP